MELVGRIAVAMWMMLLELAPWLLLGAAAAGVLHVVLPPGFVRRHLGRRGGVLKAVALGVPLPLCSCGVIPAGLGLRRDGASPGASVGFLISTPQTGVDSVLVSASLLGWPFALLKLGAAAVTGIAGGWITDAVVTDAPAAEAPASGAAPVDRSLRGALAHALDVLHSVWRWLVIGIVASALITALVPPQTFATESVQGEFVALLLVLLVSLPLYVCATASVPIAAALVAGGFPPGAALVFLMAGPATNLATLGAVYRGLGKRALIIYLSTIVVGSVGAALLFGSVLGGVGEAVHSMGDHQSLVAIASVVTLVAVLIVFAARDARTWWRGRAGNTERAKALPEIDLAVEGMTCGGCATRLRGALLEESGVVSSEVDHERGRARVRGTATAERLREIVTQAGFRVTASSSPREVSLPGEAAASGHASG